MKKFVKMLTWTVSCLLFVQAGFVGAKILSDKKCCPEKEYLKKVAKGIECGVPSTMENRFEMSFINDHALELTNQTEQTICHRKNKSPVDFVNCTDLYFNDDLLSVSHVAIKCVNQGNKTHSKILTVVNSEKEYDPKVYYMNICCPSDQVYDFRKRTCVKDKKDLSKIIPTLAGQTNLVNFQSPAAQCQSVLTDYNFTKFTIHNNVFAMEGLAKYKVNLLKNKTNWCIDASTDNPKQFIFQICENDNYCDKHMCLKKCSHFDENFKFNEFDEYVASPMVISLREALKKSTSQKFNVTKHLILNATDLGFKTYLDCPYGYQEIVPSWEMTALGHLNLTLKNSTLRNDDYCIEVINDDNNQTDLQVFTCFDINLKIPKGFSMFDYRFILIALAFFLLGIFLCVIIFDSFLFDKHKPTTC